MAEPAAALLLTKILATVGPASDADDTLVRLIEEGARVFRINFSHGGFEDFAPRIAAVRRAGERAGVPVGVLGDLSGPKIRIENVAEPFDVAKGDFVEFTTDPDWESQRFDDTGVAVLATTYPKLVDDAMPGDRVLINDGAVRMLVVDRVHAADDDAYRLHCRVTVGGRISNRKGINLPDTVVSAPSLTEWDRQCVAFALEQRVDFIALSFVRSGEDLTELRALLKQHAKAGLGGPSAARTPLIAKVEKPEAIVDLEAIVDAADGLMVARGDLGVEMDPTEVPILQKRIIRTAHEFGKPVIVATQMLESMIDQAHPTRAEVGDVANAIHEGADAVMLSGETAVGRFPIQAVNFMARAALSMERYLASDEPTPRPPTRLRDAKYRTAALAHAVSVLTEDLSPRFVVCWSELGGTARYLSQNRLPVPILAISSNDDALRKMSILFGVTTTKMERPRDSPAFLSAVDSLLMGHGWAEPGDPIVIVKGEPLGTPGVTNEARIHYVGDVCRVTWHAK